MTTDTLYTLDDCGCYVNGAAGIYATDEIVQIAREHGANIPSSSEPSEQQTTFPSEFADSERAVDAEDAATDYMNEHFAPEGAYWGRNENGDWGLWSPEDD